MEKAWDHQQHQVLPQRSQSQESLRAVHSYKGALPYTQLQRNLVQTRNVTNRQDVAAWPPTQIWNTAVSDYFTVKILNLST